MVREYEVENKNKEEKQMERQIERQMESERESVFISKNKIQRERMIYAYIYIYIYIEREIQRITEKVIEGSRKKREGLTQIDGNLRKILYSLADNTYTRIRYK